MPGSLSPNTVSWQSAFWALVALALNSMAQPSGLIFGTASQLNGFFAFAMRSSPILCAYNAITFLLCLLWHTVSLRSPHAAKRHVARSRFRNDPKDQESSLYKLQHNFIFQAATFVLGAVPQIVKLYAMRGLMWTQIWGSVYFGFFVILQTLVLFPEDASIQQDTHSATAQDHLDRPPDHDGTWLEGISGAIVLVASYWFAYHFVATATYRMTKKFGQLIWPQVIALVIVAIFTLLKTFSPKTPETLLMESLAIILVGLSCCLPTGLLGPLISAINTTQTRMEFWLCIAGTAVMALGHLSLAVYW